MLAPEQRLLLLYQRKQVVELREDNVMLTTSSEEEQVNFTKNFQDMIESEHYWLRLKALFRVT